MKVFKTFSLTWWQGVLFKLTMIGFGVAIGATWPELFREWIGVLVALSVMLMVYISTLWWKQ